MKTVGESYVDLTEQVLNLKSENEKLKFQIESEQIAKDKNKQYLDLIGNRYNIENCRAYCHDNSNCALYNEQCFYVDDCLLKCMVNRVKEVNADNIVLCDLHIWDVEEEDYV